MAAAERAQLLPRLAFGLLLVAIFVAPLPLGSNRDWAWSPLAVAIGVVAILHGAALATGAARTGPPLLPLLPAALGLGAVFVWVGFQLAFAGTFDPSNPIKDKEAALTGLMRWLTYALAFFVTATTAWTTSKARALLIAHVAAAVAITIYALVAESAAALKGGEAALLIPKLGTEFSATFVNRNNYATYSGLGALATIALLQLEGPLRRDDKEPYRLILRRFLARLGGTSGLLMAGLTILVAGVILSGSRAGAFALAVALLASWIFNRRRSVTTAVVVCLLVLFLLSLPGSTLLLTRLFSLGSGGNEPRADLYEMTIDAIAARPWTGWGFGSFPAVYSLLQPSSLPFNLDKAHNTYLELALDLGIPFAIVCVAIVLFLLARCVMGLRERSRGRPFPALAIWSAVLVGVHALFDFSLQIPAVALSFSAILGVGWAQSWSSQRY